MNTYYLTFGPDHCVYPWQSPSGWVEIYTSSLGRAREIAFDFFGDKWCQIFTEPPASQRMADGLLATVKLGELEVVK